MSNQCIDREVGKLLHAFELGLLSEKEAAAFGAHLVECSFCHDRLADSERVVDLLRYDPDVADLIRGAHSRHGNERRSIWEKLADSLWPQFPVLLRPGVLLLVVALLAYPAYLGLLDDKRDEVSALQTIELVSERNACRPPYEVAGDVSISCLFPGAEPSGRYIVSLSRDGAVLFSDSSFSGFDRFGVAWIYLPENQALDGRYTLRVEDPLATAATSSITYAFDIINQ